MPWHCQGRCRRGADAIPRASPPSSNAFHLAPGGEAGTQARVNRNQTAALLLGGTVARLDDETDFAGRPQDHVPGQLGDLASAQASLERQEYNQMVSVGVSGRGGKDEEASCLLFGKYLGLFSHHNEVQLDVYVAAY
jgi:hypothetical protein